MSAEAEKKSSFSVDTEALEYTREGEESRVSIRISWADVFSGIQKLFKLEDSGERARLTEVK